MESLNSPAADDASSERTDTKDTDSGETGTRFDSSIESFNSGNDAEAADRDDRTERDVAFDDAIQKEDACIAVLDDPTCPRKCPEVCNGKDDDCDGLTDEEPAADSCNLDHTQVECAMGECLLVACAEGFANCDNEEITGCETRLGTITDCDNCNDSCECPNAEKVSCRDNVCQIDVCESGYANCDDEIENGCEERTDSLEHCGACNRPCLLDHAETSCDSHECVVVGCESGWENCDLLDDNGCEHDQNDGPCPTLSAQYMPESGDNKWIRSKFVIRNLSPNDIPITVVSLRYWYTVDAGSTTQFFECWHPDEAADCSAGFCCGDHIAYNIVPTSGVDADYYLELSFTGGPDIPAHGELDHITVGIHKDTWEDYILTNDYSYDPFTELTETQRITLHRNDAEDPEEPVWGIRP